MYEPTTYDLLDERIKKHNLQLREKDEIEFKIRNLEYQIETFKIQLEELEKDISYSENRIKKLELKLQKEGVDDKKVRQFVRDANIRAARGF